MSIQQLDYSNSENLCYFPVLNEQRTFNKAFISRVLKSIGHSASSSFAEKVSGSSTCNAVVRCKYWTRHSRRSDLLLKKITVFECTYRSSCTQMVPKYVQIVFVVLVQADTGTGAEGADLIRDQVAKCRDTCSIANQ